MVDQTAIRGSRRSNPATYTGLLEPIRKAFAKANGVKPALFSNNSEGACPVCKGAGMIYTELGFMETVSTPCEECEGRRVPHRRARVPLGEEGHRRGARPLRRAPRPASYSPLREPRSPAAAKLLGHLEDVGLGYLTIGQPLTTLSGGERQRLKLATRMGDTGGHLCARRADHRPSSRGRRPAALPAGPPRGFGEDGDRDRASSGGDGSRRSSDRSRPRGGRRRRAGRLRGHCARAARSPRHRRSPGSI